jgi:EAL domain-containing protein (putative c-di-GMP-specific phosphodiesterase class I)/ActR/RegA family two-component response regulator
MSERMQNRLLVIDDEVGICEFVGEVASDLGFEARLTTMVGEFRTALNDFEPSVIVMDLQMPDLDGVELLRELSERGCTAQIILMSGMDSRVLSTAEHLGKSLGLKMLGLQPKPIMLDDLEAMLSKVLVSGRRTTVADLKQALVSGQFHVHYQPKARRVGQSWQVDSAEALIRWRHPRFGLMLPEEFIPLAESTGMIGEMTDFVFKSVADQVRRWRTQNRDFKVAVNCSAALINDLLFPDRLAGFLKEAGVDPSAIVVEITESAAMSDPTLTMDILTRLRLKNFGLSVDDFGTGYSSLVQLHQMPFNELKIDSSFVREMVDDSEARTIVEALVMMAKKLGLQVCAEGVETSQALDFLGKLNCDSIQGFLISPAVSAQRFLEVVDAWNAHGDPSQKPDNVILMRANTKED